MSPVMRLLIILTAFALQGCMPAIWNASDLVDWVTEQAIDSGCESDTIELEDWYRKSDSGNFWHGTCRNAADESMSFAIDIDPVWTPSES